MILMLPLSSQTFMEPSFAPVIRYYRKYQQAEVSKCIVYDTIM